MFTNQTLQTLRTLKLTGMADGLEQQLSQPSTHEELGFDERLALMERDRDHWGREFIVLPNPTDGHWVRAIFGDSEPAPTDENRRLLKAAATQIAWDGN